MPPWDPTAPTHPPRGSEAARTLPESGSRLCRSDCEVSPDRDRRQGTLGLEFPAAEMGEVTPDLGREEEAGAAGAGDRDETGRGGSTVS